MIPALGLGVWLVATRPTNPRDATSVRLVPEATPTPAGPAVIRPDSIAVLDVTGLGEVTVYTTVATFPTGPTEVHCLATAERATCGGGGDNPVWSTGDRDEPPWVMLPDLPSDATLVELASGEGTLIQKPVARTAIFVGDNAQVANRHDINVFDDASTPLDYPTASATFPPALSPDAQAVADDEQHRGELEHVVNDTLASCLAGGSGLPQPDLTPLVVLPAVPGIDYDTLWGDCTDAAVTAWRAELDHLATST